MAFTFWKFLAATGTSAMKRGCDNQESEQTGICDRRTIPQCNKNRDREAKLYRIARCTFGIGVAALGPFNQGV
jgi:hypothetical protein